MITASPTTSRAQPERSVSLSILQQLADFDTALIANTIGYVDPTPDHEFYMGGSIASATPTLGPTVGVAMTCEVDTSTPGGKTSMEQYFEIVKAIEGSKVPVVLVAKTVGSRPDHECVFGDGMAKLLRSVGCIGAVTDGGARDINGMLTTGFAMYCRGRTIHHTAIRFTRINTPIQIGGITVSPGDVIHANAEGVIKIPHACLNILPERAAAMRAFEHEVHIAWRDTSLTIEQKRAAVRPILDKYKFSTQHRS